VEKAIGRSRNNRLKMDVIPEGKEAKSAFYKLGESDTKVELIAVKLFTGRTHQIRVHLNSLGRHILGDVLYGFKSKRDTIKRVYLHAYKLYLTHPVSEKRVEFVAPLFSDMRYFIDKNFNQGEIDEKINPTAIDGYFRTLVNRM
jgi:23S rRNA pseudouridine1911/1915/1917 synthase